MVDFSLERVSARRQWNIIFKMAKGKTISLESLFSKDIIQKSE